METGSWRCTADHDGVGWADTPVRFQAEQPADEAARRKEERVERAVMTHVVGDLACSADPRPG